MTSTITTAAGHLRSLLAVAVLVVPLAIVAPSFVRGETLRANGYDPTFALPYGVPPGEYNKALAIAVVEHVPSHASVAMVGENLRTDGARWIAYVIAPRELIAEPARWTMVLGETPQQAHLRPVRSWRYGADWLVEG